MRTLGLWQDCEYCIALSSLLQRLALYGLGKEANVLCDTQSAILALLQMIETQRGQIIVDGVDLSTMSCTDVRSHLNVVPQDPFLMPGTIRFNIDPFGKVSDKNIIRTLERVRVWAIISTQGGLSKEMDTVAWSAGQKQLLCLARAMVGYSKVLILDKG